MSGFSQNVSPSSTTTLTNKSIDDDNNTLSNIAVAALKDGTDGELITWGADGVATTVAVGTSGHVLTSNGVGAAPTFQAAAGGGDTVNYMWIGAGAWVVETAEQTYVGGGGPAIKYVDGVSDEAHFNFYIPTGYTTISDIQIYCIANAGNANIYANFICHRDRDGSNTVSDNSGFTSVAVNTGSQGELFSIPSGSYNTLSETTGDMIGVAFVRDASHANDTLNNDLWVGGALITFS